MVKFIEEKDYFFKLLELRNRLINYNPKLPVQVFKPDYKVFRIMDFVSVLTPLFLDRIKELTKKFGYEEIVLMMLDPSPLAYYYHYFKKYGAIVFNCNDSSDEVAHTCMESPPESKGDAFNFVVNSFALFPVCQDIPEWALYRDRLHCEASIVAFKNHEIRKEFIKLDTEHISMGAKEAIDTLMSMCFVKGVPEAFKKEFLKNYDR